MSILETPIITQLESTLKQKCSGYQYQITIGASETYMLRYAKSRVHQNNHSSDSHIDIQLVKDNKIASVSLNQWKQEEVSSIIEQLKETCSLVQENPEFVGYPSETEIIHTEEIEDIQSEPFSEAGGKILSQVFKEATSNSIDAYGKLMFENHHIGILNSNGIRNESRVSFTKCQTQMMKGRLSGFAQTSGSCIQELEIERMTKDAVATCLQSEKPIEIEPGIYPVILKPEAVADLVQMMSFVSFGTKGIDEKRSFLSDKLHKQIMSPILSITDDPTHPKQVAFLMDSQGVVHSKPVKLVENGVFSNMVFDYKYAMKYDKANTGNATPGNRGPFPFNLVLSSSETQQEEKLIKNLQKGILITRFWYANPVNPMKGELTALTRDGTFLIENGKQIPIKNLRYTDSVFKILSSAIAASTTSRFFGSSFMGVVAPSLLCERMRFTESLPE